jgi:hypothetical protein
MIEMKKRASTRRKGATFEKPILWLPVDSRLFPFFSFSHVKGLARLFLLIEIVLSLIVVIGSCALVCLSYLG